MLLVRPAQVADLDALVALAQGAGIGLTTLSKDADVLRNRLEEARHAFRPGVRRAGGESYFFVLEDLMTGRLAGCCGIVALVGGYEPFYCYQIETTRKSSKQLGISREVRALHLVADHKGPSEIGTLFLRPDQRGHGAGRLLSLARFAFMAAFPERFAPDVIAEMRGVVSEDGHSPFWEAIGRHFFEVDFAEADARSGHDKQFIADLMPDHPIYIPMLSPEAQAVIGEVHPEARPALRLLEQEGFRFDERAKRATGGASDGERLAEGQSEPRTLRAERATGGASDGERLAEGQSEPRTLGAKRATRGASDGERLAEGQSEPRTLRVDIFDGGPLIRAERTAIRTIRETRTGTLAAVLPGGAEGGSFLVSNPRLDFRACLGEVGQAETGVTLSRDVALALDLRLGDRVAWSPLRG